MDVWPWICEIADSDEPLVFQLASSKSSSKESTQSIQLVAERISGSGSDSSLTFSVRLEGFQVLGLESTKTLWVSDTCPVSSDKPFLPLVLQLLREIVTLSPHAPESQLPQVKPAPVAWVMDSHSPESFSRFFALAFLTRLFWSCSCYAPSEVGSLFFQALLGPTIEVVLSQDAPALRTFFISVGVDVELCFIRTVSYMLTKWLISSDVAVGLYRLKPLRPHQLGFSYSNEAHGFWISKGYFPILGMNITNPHETHRKKFPIVDAKEAVVRYTLAHQQLEAVIQLEYSVKFTDKYIQVKARIDNIRIHMASLRFGTNNSDGYAEQRYFPTRVRIWVGPEIGASYVTCLSLSPSTNYEERKLEVYHLLQGVFGKSKVQNVKVKAKTSTKTNVINWKYDQEAEGNLAIFDAVMHDKGTGEEIVTLKQVKKPDYNGYKNRYSCVNRGFTKSGRTMFSGKEYGDKVRWRVSKEMEGSVLKWRIGSQVWLTSHYETRFVEWSGDVDLPLLPTN